VWLNGIELWLSSYLDVWTDLGTAKLYKSLDLFFELKYFAFGHLFLFLFHLSFCLGKFSEKVLFKFLDLWRRVILTEIMAVFHALSCCPWFLDFFILVLMLSNFLDNGHFHFGFNLIQLFIEFLQLFQFCLLILFSHQLMKVPFTFHLLILLISILDFIKSGNFFNFNNFFVLLNERPMQRLFFLYLCNVTLSLGLYRHIVSLFEVFCLLVELMFEHFLADDHLLDLSLFFWWVMRSFLCDTTSI